MTDNAPPPAFGTSGLRGLVVHLTPALVADYVAAFVAVCPTGGVVYVGHDLRDSSPEIAGSVAKAARAAGQQVVACGPVPTPALALAAMTAGAAAVMVTGSHIPADRNGLKFYTPAGEITKADEVRMRDALGAQPPQLTLGAVRQDEAVAARYAARYLSAFGEALTGRRIGLYQHSAVGRDLMQDLLAQLGAEVIPLARSDTFVPVDTEAIAPELRADCRAWAVAHGCDAIVSTDADGDRPLLTDETGAVVPGDVLGQITARFLGADQVVTPVSSNTSAALLGHFAKVQRTRIGSPHVIAGMEALGGKVAGYEANGGFLLGFDADGPRGALPALMTRDALLPIVATLAAAGDGPVSALVAKEMPRVTRADRLQEVPTADGQALVARWTESAEARAGFLAALGEGEGTQDTTDGLRLILQSGRIVHIRPSGNAPELRLYVEADSPEEADDLLARGLASLRAAL